MSVGHFYCYCGRILPGASEEAQKQITKNVIQNFDLLTTSAIKNQEGIIAWNQVWYEKRSSRSWQSQGRFEKFPTQMLQYHRCTI